MITLVHLLPGLLNLYGDGANLVLLKAELEAAGAETEIIRWTPGTELDFPAVSLIYAGPGTERRIDKAAELLAPYRTSLSEAKAAGVPMLFCGTAAELVGTEIRKAEETVPALGLTGCRAVRFDGRHTGDVLYGSDLSDRLLAGFVNKSSWIENVEAPAFRSQFGIGGICDESGRDTGTEGVLDGSLLATYCTGPVLVRNPWLRRLFAKKILERAGAAMLEVEGTPQEDSFDRGYEVTVDELKKRII